MSLSEADPFFRDAPAVDWDLKLSTGNTPADSLERVTEAMAFLMEAYEQDMAATDKVLQALLQELTSITQQAKAAESERGLVEQAQEHLQSMEAENAALADQLKAVRQQLFEATQNELAYHAAEPKQVLQEVQDMQALLNRAEDMLSSMTRMVSSEYKTLLLATKRKNLSEGEKVALAKRVTQVAAQRDAMHQLIKELGQRR